MRLDPASAATVAELRYGPGVPFPREVAVGAGGVWVDVADNSHPLLRLEAATGAARESGVGRTQLFARGGVLHSTRSRTCLVSVAPWIGSPRTVRMCARLLAYPRDLAASGGALWWAGLFTRTRGVVIRRAADGSGPARSWGVGRDPVDVVPAGRGVWVLSRTDRRLTRVAAAG